MNVKLSLTPVSRNPVDLLAVVLDDATTLHQIDDAAIAAFESSAICAPFISTVPVIFQTSASPSTGPSLRMVVTLISLAS